MIFIVDDFSIPLKFSEQKRYTQTYNNSMQESRVISLLIFNKNPLEIIQKSYQTQIKHLKSLINVLIF
jgi:hypothetical protein